MLRLEKCVKCDAEFKAELPSDVVCPKCAKALPECDSCHRKMSTKYGYMEDFAKKVGDYSICGSCDGELRRKKLLHIANFQYLMPDGSVKTKRR